MSDADEADEAAERVNDRVDEARAIYERQGRVLRFLWIVVGILVALGGLVMAAIPGGPAALVLPVGLVMLSVVFGWARRLLMFSVAKGVWAKKLVESTDTKVKALGFVVWGCLNVAVIAVIIVWIAV